MSEAQEPRVGERRPGGRSTRVREAVLEATIEALADSSYEGLRIDDVAARAGVNKTTIYRRWPTKAELVADATRSRSQQNVPIPDTGSLAGDVRALARSVAANLRSPAGAQLSRTLVSAAATSADVAAESARFWSERLALARVVVERAVSRGELGPGVDPYLVIEALIGPLYVRLLLTGEPVTRSFADAVSSLVAAGARAEFPPTLADPPARYR